MKRKRPRKPRGVHLVLQDGTVIDSGPDTVVTLRMYGPGGGGGNGKLYPVGRGGRLAKNGFVVRPDEPINPMAWLGIAQLVEAKVYPWLFEYGAKPRLTEIALLGHGDLITAIKHAREGDHWRRVLLPMLLEEAKRRGIET